MSKLNELLRELCSKGVCYKELQSLAEIGTGSSDRKDSVEDGEYPFYVRSKDVLRINKYEFDEEAIVIPGEGGIGEIFHFVQGKYALHQRAYRIHIIDPALSTKFLYYYMAANFKSFILQKAVSATVTSIRKPMIEQFPVPIPPKDVQIAIVDILDSFTELIETITADLAVELSARKKQYEYYRDHLIAQKASECKTAKLSELAEIYDGTHQTPDYKSEGIPFISVENIGSIYSSSKYISEEAFGAFKIKPQIGDLFMTRIGSIGKCAVMSRQQDLAYYVSLALIRPKAEIIDVRYLRHYIESTAGSKELAKRTLHHAVPIKINKDDIGKITIKYPSIELQSKIADILDRYETARDDYNGSLLSEIESRKQQYRYYRDKLLTFKEL